MEDAGGGKIGRPGSSCGWNKNCRRNFEIFPHLEISNSRNYRSGGTVGSTFPVIGIDG